MQLGSLIDSPPRRWRWRWCKSQSGQHKEFVNKKKDALTWARAIGQDASLARPHGRFESKQPTPSVKLLINSKSSGGDTEEFHCADQSDHVTRYGSCTGSWRGSKWKEVLLLPLRIFTPNLHIFLSVCPLSASRESRLEECGYICKSTGRGGKGWLDTVEWNTV